MPPPPAASDAPAAAEDNANAANDNADGSGSRRSLRARPQHVSYRDDELAWEALFNQDSDDDDDDGDDGRGDDEARGGGEQRPKGKRGRPPKNQGERVGPVETVLGPSGRQVSGIWKGKRRGRERRRRHRPRPPPASAGSWRSRFAVFFLRCLFWMEVSVADGGNLFPFLSSRSPLLRPRDAIDTTSARVRA